MALHHALKLLDPQARAVLCFFMQGTSTLVQHLIQVLEDELANEATEPTRTPAELKKLKKSIKASKGMLDQLGISVTNIIAVEKYADEFVFGANHAVFVQTVKSLDSWWRNPATIKAIGRQKGILEVYYFIAIQLTEILAPQVLRTVPEPYVIMYNYTFTVVLVATMLQEAPNTSAFDEGVIDPTWHPLDVGRVPYPLPEEAKIRRAIEELGEGERLYLQAIYIEMKNLMATNGMSLKWMVEELDAKYTHPLATAFEKVVEIFDDTLVDKNEASEGGHSYAARLIEEFSMPDAILDLRARMAYCEPTPFIYPLTAPLKILATVTDLLLDRRGNSVLSFLMLGLFHTTATEEDIRHHFSSFSVVTNVFDVLTKKIPPEILAPSMLTVELLRPLLDEVFTDDGQERLDSISKGEYRQLCPILIDEGQTKNVIETVKAFTACAEEFRANHPDLLPDLDDQQAVREMLLRLPEDVKYIRSFPSGVSEVNSPADLYLGILLVWVVSMDMFPPLMRKGYLKAPAGLEDTLELFFRLVRQIGGNELMGGVKFDEQVDNYSDIVEKAKAASAKKKEEKARKDAFGELDDEVPEGTIFN